MVEDWRPLPPSFLSGRPCEKSVSKPKQSLMCLAFIINYKDMTLKLTEEKKQKNYNLFTSPFEKSIRFVTQDIGNIVVNFPAVPLGPIFYGALETDRIISLKIHKQSYDTKTELSNEAYSELVWRKNNIKILFRV